MIYSISSSNNLVRYALVLFTGLLFGGCAFFQERPEPTVTLPAPVAGMPSPQVVDTVTIAWQMEAPQQSGNTYRFEWARSGESLRRSSPLAEPRWQWQPKETGHYRVRVVRFADDGSFQLSGWSEPFVIVAPLRVESLAPDRPAPQAAESVPVNWQALISGGVPPYSYQFELATGQQQRFVQQGAESP